MKYLMSKIGIGFLIANIGVGAAYAQHFSEIQEGYVTRSEAIFATRTVQEPRSTIRCNEPRGSQNTSLGQIVVGGLIGSAIGNKLSDRDGAGTLGAVAGVLHATNSNNRQRCFNETHYTSRTEQYPSHYLIHVRTGGKQLQFTSNRPYQRNERVRLNVSTNFSLVR
jgi:uncharacterized protein YcfJ